MHCVTKTLDDILFICYINYILRKGHIMELYEKNGNILYVLNILKKYSNSDHPLSSNKIKNLIKEEYNVDIDSRTVRRNINLLIETNLMFII